MSQDDVTINVHGPHQEAEILVKDRYLEQRGGMGLDVATVKVQRKEDGTEARFNIRVYYKNGKPQVQVIGYKKTSETKKNVQATYVDYGAKT